MAIFATVPFHAGAVRIDYEINAGIERDDNVLMSPTDPQDANALRAGFGFLLAEETSTVLANFGGRLEYWNYIDGPQSNTLEGNLAGRLNWSIVPEVFSFTVEDSLQMRPIDRFAADTPGNRQRVNVLSLGPNVQFNWSRAFLGRAELRWIDTRAAEDDDIESQRVAAALHAIRELGPTSVLSFSARGQDVDYTHDLIARDHRRYDAYMRYDQELRRLGFGLVAGYTWVDYADGSSASHPLLRGRINWVLGSRNTVALEAAHQMTDASESALAGITAITSVPDGVSSAPMGVNSSIYEEDRIAFHWAHHRERADFTLGSYYERIDFQDATTFDETRRGLLGQVTYRLAPTWEVHSFADVARSEFPDLGLRTNDRRYGLGVAKQWSRHWSSALDYMHYRRRGDGSLASASQNVWYLTVTYRNR
ncbi:hypothetical protein ACOPJQ_10300 [Luteimonas dalianensis]|uniref:hypothetical protein n=1 Tax=Luteimonas dalianensis TaxID=1148196 RepID=UPI003BF23032